MTILKKPLRLPCGVTVKNRFFKSAMHEGLGSKTYAPTQAHVSLYHRWSAGGSGVLVTGNVMVDRNHLGEPGNVVIEDERDLAMLKKWAAAGSRNGTQLWMQLNHPGKQSPKSINSEPIAPSALAFDGNLGKLFATPRAMTESDIREVQARFITAAVIAQKAGFTGVQIHAAHGYLISQFLSPLHNQRQDSYGGSLENRQRFLLEIYEGMRAALGRDFPISVKLNSSDGSLGGFSVADSLNTAQRLSELGVDVIEVSGGTYAAPTMQGEGGYNGEPGKAIFADFALRLSELVDTPVALTGGFRTAESMVEAVSASVSDLVGIARPLVLDPDLPLKVFAGKLQPIKLPRIKSGVQKIDDSAGSMLGIIWYELQMARLAKGRLPRYTKDAAARVILHAVVTHGPAALKRRRA